MDPRKNPYKPGAGRRPPELAGRDEILAEASIAIQQSKSGMAARSLMLVGLRGVGKTALLNAMKDMAGKEGAIAGFIEVSRSDRLSDAVTVILRAALLKLDSVECAGDMLKRALRALKSFAGATKAKCHDAEFFLDIGKEPGVADSGVLARDLAELFVAVGEAAKECESSIAIFVDEIQNLPAEEFEALVMAIHRANQLDLPIMIVGAGLPLLVSLSGNVKSYSERLFEYPEIGPLDEEESRRALVMPLSGSGVKYEDKAIETVVEQTKGHPYFLQLWGYEAWNAASESTIAAADIQKAGEAAIQRLDENFFRSRYDRLSGHLRDYLRAMAQLGPGPHKTGDIAGAMGMDTKELGGRRKKLIAKGMIYSPEYGKTAFTAPLFDEFMKRMHG